MNRRDAIARVGLLVGGTVIGADAFLTGCKRSPEQLTAASAEFSPDTIAFLDEVGETILPASASSPGAKEAKIGEFMKAIVTDCYEEKNQKYNKDFMELAAGEKHDLLVAIDGEMKDYSKNKKEGDPEHYFTLMKQLTLWGYFTSEPGSTKALRYLPVPGKFEGCIPYKKGDKAWAAT
jgi:hypothetical protein